MSVWKRFQRVGKKAAKYQFTASYTELLIETNSFKPSQLVITWLRRNRKYASEPVKLIEVPYTQHSYSYVWEVPRNEEIQTTLYKMKKDVEFEEKYWTFQLEDVGNGGTRRRLLAYRNIDISQYAQALPTQTNIEIIFKISSKKVKTAKLFLTLSSVFLREGDATDEDMISVASLMSLKSHQLSTSLAPNDIAVLSDLDDMNTSITSEPSVNISDEINELCGQIGNRDWTTEKLADLAIVDRNDSYSRKSDQDDMITHKIPFSKPITIKVDHNDDQLFSIAEDDPAVGSESNNTADLLEWCQSICEHYKDVKITNFTTSFRNGMAFCAIIHKFRPDLIDFENLKSSNVKENNRIAFTVAATLGIPKVLDPNEMSFLKVPDSLLVMTYVHQLRTHFTENNLIITPASIGNNSENNYSKQVSSSLSTSPTEIKDINNINLTKPNEMRDNKPPTPAQCSPESNRLPAATNIKESEVKSTIDTNPFNFFDEPESVKTHKNKSPKKPKKTLSSFNVDGSVKDKWSLSEKKIKPVTMVPLNMYSELDSKDNQTNISPRSVQSNGHSVSPPYSKKHSFAQETNVNDNYIAAETEALEREQEKIDEEASRLERQLRAVMGKDKKNESILLGKWFHIVSKKNALIRRNMQLQILDKEQNLERKWNLLQEELRQIITVEEWSKTEEMKRREELLMNDLVSIINQRDRVVKELDEYEQRIATDLEWARNNQDKVSMSALPRSLASAKFSDKNCIIQ